MAQLPMYAAAVNSPGTELAADINATDTEITVLDASKLPAAPNLVTVGGDESAETIRYTGKTGNTLTGCTRGFEGTAKGWAAGTQAARNHTAYDYEAGRANIADVNTRVDNIVIPDGTTAQKGIVQLSSKTDGESETVAATEKAVNDGRMAASADATTKATNAQTAAKMYSDGLVGALANLQTSAKGNAVAAINELFTSVSDGKTAIAAAITGKNVPASGSDTFPQLATKIGQISTGPKYATGTVTSASATAVFTSQQDTVISLPYVVVTGLGFRPNRIIIRISGSTTNLGMTVYSIRTRNASPAEPAVDYNVATVITSDRGSGYNIRVYERLGSNSSYASVSDTQFTMPVSGNGDRGLSYTWEAFQV